MSRGQQSQRGNTQIYEELIYDSGLDTILGNVKFRGIAEKNSGAKRDTLVKNFRAIVDAIVHDQDVDRLAFKLYVNEKREDNKSPTKQITSATAFESAFSKGRKFSLIHGYFGTEEQLKRMARKLAGKDNSKDFVLAIMEAARLTATEARAIQPYLLISAANKEEIGVFTRLFPESASNRLTEEEVERHINVINNVVMYMSIPTEASVDSSSVLEGENARLYKSITSQGRVARSLSEKIEDLLDKSETDTANGDVILITNINKEGKPTVEYTIGTATVGKLTKKVRGAGGIARHKSNLTVSLGQVGDRDLYIRVPWQLAQDDEFLSQLETSNTLADMNVRNSILSAYTKAQQQENRQRSRQEADDGGVDDIPSDLENQEEEDDDQEEEDDDQVVETGEDVNVDPNFDEEYDDEQGEDDYESEYDDEEATGM